MKANLQSLNLNLARRTGRETVLIFLGAGVGLREFGLVFGSSKELVRAGGIGGFEEESFSSSDSLEELSLTSVVFSFPERFRKEEDFRRREKEGNLSPTERLITERLFFLFAPERLLDISKSSYKMIRNVQKCSLIPVRLVSAIIAGGICSCFRVSIHL